MFPVLVYQGFRCNKYTTLAATAQGDFSLPLVLQRHLTAISFTPSHSIIEGHLGFRAPLTHVICYLNRAIGADTET